MTLKRVETTPLNLGDIATGEMCPNCGVTTIRAVIPCPHKPNRVGNGYVKCDAIHLGWRCKCCNIDYYDPQQPSTVRSFHDRPRTT